MKTYTVDSLFSLFTQYGDFYPSNPIPRKNMLVYTYTTTGTRQRTGKEQTSQNKETIVQLLPLSPLCSLSLSLSLSLSPPNGKY